VEWGKYEPHGHIGCEGLLASFHMTSRHLVDPELVAFLDRLPAGELSNDTLAGVRNALAQMGAQAVLQRQPEVEVGTQFVESRDGTRVRILTYQPIVSGMDMPAILHFHGGGYVAGSPEMSDITNAQMALSCNAIVASVDYRLAPECRFPLAIEDGYAALNWLVDSAHGLSIDRDRLALAGESAGGGLAGGLALMARDRGGPPIAHVSLIYPMVDDRTYARGKQSFQGEFVWQVEKNMYGWRSLLGSDYGIDSVSPYAALSRAEDLRKLAPTFIGVGALDLFLEQDLELARRLAVAGVATELHVYPGAYHGFYSMNGTWLANAAQHDRLDALRRAFNHIAPARN